MNHKLAKSLRYNSMWLGLIILVALAPSYGQAADTGTSVGIFLDPTPSCPPATCSGIGTNSFSWGEPTSSFFGSQGNLTFAGDSFSPAAGETFKLGTLTYHNGGTIQGTDVTGIGLDILLDFDNPSRNFTYHTDLSITNTSDISDPQASDVVDFFDTMTTLYVGEGATASVNLMGKLTQTDGQFQLVSVSIVPEPSIYAMLLAGLSFIGLAASRRTRPTLQLA